MVRPSKLMEKLENRVEKRFGKLYERHRKKIKYLIPLGLCVWYFYGMVLNSIRLGIDSTFGEALVETIWIVNPLLNLLAVFTPTGLAVTGVGVLLFCLITKKGYVFYSGYKFKRDPRGFDILPDGTHGTSGFLSKKETAALLETGPIKEVPATLVGKRKDKLDDADKYADYIGVQNIQGLNNNILVFGAPGSG